jgi:hypothetical protein
MVIMSIDIYNGLIVQDTSSREKSESKPLLEDNDTFYASGFSQHGHIRILYG